MKNKLSDLNDHLFMQLERLGNEELSAEQIEQEAARAEAIVSVSDQIIRNADLQVKAAKLMVDNGAFIKRHMTSFPMIEGIKNEG
ncbi:hypothetical protein [uncultured Cohaesibacter sp.]|uniref:hypothetical protein n=1 Tax=uncultured Cohaesibacter sp. TaxID=1002546 RepID=UPI0029C90A9D|nr:hypothetical protein [uncultured Cohaesibacter sp.]